MLKAHMPRGINIMIPPIGKSGVSFSLSKKSRKYASYLV